MDLKSLYLLNTHVVTCRAVGLCGFRNSLLVKLWRLPLWTLWNVRVSVSTTRIFSSLDEARSQLFWNSLVSMSLSIKTLVAEVSVSILMTRLTHWSQWSRSQDSEAGLTILWRQSFSESSQQRNEKDFSSEGSDCMSRYIINRLEAWVKGLRAKFVYGNDF